MTTSTPASPSLVFPSKPSDAVMQLSFPFLDLMQWNEHLVSSSFTILVASGVDVNPAAMLVGSTIGSPNTTLLLQVQGGLAGVIYLISAKVLGSSENTYQRSGLLAIT